MLFGEFVEIVAHHLLHELLEPRVLAPAYLQQQAFLQRAGSDAGGVEVLQQLQYVLYLLWRRVDVLVDGQFVADGVEAFAQQPVVVERADEVFHDVVLALAEVYHAQLVVQLVLKRRLLAEVHFLALLAHGLSAAVYGQFLVVAPDAGQCLVECRLAFLALALGVEIVVGAAFFSQVVVPVAVVVGSGLERRVIVHFCLNALYQLRHRHLNELCLQ